ncbi:MAG: histidine phosphatase family protein [Spirochaetales bacterium]
MILYYLRHGESQNNVLDSAEDWTTARSSEPDLTEHGVKQAERTAQLFSRAAATDRPVENYNPYRDEAFAITHIYSSPHLRAIRTAAPIAAQLRMAVNVYEDIHEAGGTVDHDREAGVYRGASGVSRAEANSVCDRLVFPDHLAEAGWWNGRAPETEEQRVLRAKRVRKELLEAHGPDDRVLLVSHTHFHVYFICSILGLPYRDGYWITLNNCALTRISFDRRGVRIEYLNRQDHLLPDLLG